jgi:di/tricarboxylate transporter
MTTQRMPALAPFLIYRPGLLVSGAAMLLCLLLLAAPPESFSPGESRGAALAVLVIGLWAGGAIAEHLTALLFFLLAMLLSVAPPGIVFSGFSSVALWLVFSGLVMGLAVRTTGLGTRVAGTVARALSRGYLTLIAGVVLVGVVLGFLMPSSMGRVILLIPIGVAIAEHFGFEKGSNGRTAIVLAAAFGSHVPTFAILPANVPNMVLAGASETIYGITPGYGEYLLLHFPILGIFKAVLLIGLIGWMFPDRLRPKGLHADHRAAALTGDERKLTWVLGIALVLWMTDAIHHVSPAWIALGAALVLMLPRFGMISPSQFNEKLNYASVFFVAGVLGLGAVVSESGLGNRLAAELLAIVPLQTGHDALNYASLATISLATGMLTTLPGVPAVLTPLADQLSQASGLPAKTVLMTQVLGFSTTVLPYQSAPLVVGMQLAGEPLAPAIKLCLALAVLSVLVLWPLDYFWWQLLGWL